MTTSGVDTSTWLESTKQPHVTGSSVACVCTCRCEGQNATSGIIPWGTLHFYFLDRVSQWLGTHQAD